jgi:purine-binding chemotaxis protein CheW
MSRKRQRFDWQAIHAELDGRLERFSRTVDDDADRVRQLLDERATALAATPEDERDRRLHTRLLVFALGDEEYALPLACAREVTGLSRPATIPGAGSEILGIVNWRGEFAVVFDLAAVLGLPATEDRARRRVIVLRGEDPFMALAVDGVDRVIEADLSALQPRQQLQLKRVELFHGATSDAVLVLADDSLRTRLDEELRAA